jgi:hypothetical protein
MTSLTSRQNSDEIENLSLEQSDVSDESAVVLNVTLHGISALHLRVKQLLQPHQGTVHSTASHDHTRDI